MKKVKKFFKNIFRIRINSNFVKRSMIFYFQQNNWKYQDTITDIKVYRTFKTLYITVTSHHPGIFIGKGGLFINGLEQFMLSDTPFEKVKIDVLECKLWSNLYKNFKPKFSIKSLKIVEG